MTARGNMRWARTVNACGTTAHFPRGSAQCSTADGRMLRCDSALARTRGLSAGCSLCCPCSCLGRCFCVEFYSGLTTFFSPALRIPECRGVKKVARLKLVDYNVLLGPSPRAARAHKVLSACGRTYYSPSALRLAAATWLFLTWSMTEQKSDGIREVHI